jgi:hypothetical protein
VLCTAETFSERRVALLRKAVHNNTKHVFLNRNFKPCLQTLNRDPKPYSGIVHCRDLQRASCGAAAQGRAWHLLQACTASSDRGEQRRMQGVLQGLDQTYCLWENDVLIMRFFFV